MGRETKPFPIPYVCSLSRTIRAGCVLMGANLQPMIENLVTQFENDPELVKSLRDSPKPEGGHYMRQVDVRNDANEIIMKVFMKWDHDKKWWHAFVEGPNETCFENQELNY